MRPVRVRFAPSPTGELHIGGARTALFNYLVARASNGTFILRIDDTDLERSRPEYTDGLLNSLRWLGLDWDEGPYFQSQRLEEYNRAAARLLEEDKAYHCYCTPEELAAGREAARKAGKPYLYPGTCRDLSQEETRAYLAAGRSPVIRLRTPDRGETVVRDLIRGEVRFDNSNLDDFIIVKSNGLPTYNFASVVDDALMQISDVIRGEEHLSNTPRQQLCIEALGYEAPRFAHVPMILAPDRSKLSKRHGATSVEEFRGRGYLPEALLNYIALLGWSPGEKEIVSLSEMVSLFSLERVNKTAAIYDTNKLTWMNGHYLREAPLEQLTEKALPFFEAEGLLHAPVEGNELDYFQKIVDTVRDRVKTLAELAEASTYFYRDDFSYEPKGVEKHFRKEGTDELLRRAADLLRKLEPFELDSIEKAYRSLSEDLGISTGRLIHPTRLAISGKTMGPGLFEIIVLLGRNRTVERLERAARWIG
ncbi:MAG TPA: glutamate--tRNA ligase [Bacillota bacterium]|nr:glutamate--tRNA ligase [Bacillota bacterium]HOA34979.1 glutamate--tRNA ligase [Bacillota bacterium]HOJ84948.1 glutamate--tRNA ligase [Bacillota bacterium]HPZ11136.1 glutamate--tRNA ligase [Bacillota bacterium]HQE09211.1 glutamate--tRNA ligase [Bacillota bacterium]